MNLRVPSLLFAMVLPSCRSTVDEENFEATPPAGHEDDLHHDEDSSEPDAAQPTVVDVQPEAFDLGTIDPRCPLDLEVSLTASGDESAGTFTASAPEGWSVTVEPVQLDTGKSSTVYLSWDGTADDPSGELILDFEAHERISVPLWALPEVPSDSLTVDLGERSEADVLFAVDRSCSMDDMARIDPNWPVLRSRLNDSGISLRMASVVEDDGCVLGDPIVLDDSLDDEAFRTALWDQQNWRGDWGFYTERLLELSNIALNAECNAELVQGNAPLHVLAFSDEPDQSAEDWNVYVEQMSMLTDPGVPFTVHGIGKDSEECEMAHWYTGVLEATESTGGVFLDFCTEDWSVALTELADGIAAASRRVVLSTLDGFEGEVESVYSEGTELTGWSVDNDDLLLPTDTALSGELTLQFWLSPTCEE